MKNETETMLHSVDMSTFGCPAAYALYSEMNASNASSHAAAEQVELHCSVRCVLKHALKLKTLICATFMGFFE